MKYLLLTSAALLVACSPTRETAPIADADLAAVPERVQTVDVALATEAMRVLSADDMQGRRAGTEGNRLARDYIIEQATALNGGTAPDSHAFSRTITRRDGETVDIVGTNLVVTLPGQAPDGPILEVTAHFDHLGMRDDDIYNGADDNASGVGALLAILKSFRATPPEHEVRIVWLDAEEMGLTGARAYVEERLDARPRVNLNLDMIAQNDEGLIFMAGAHHTPALKPIVEAAAIGTGLDLRFGHDRPEDGPNDWTGQSDHGAFHAVGIPFVYLGVEDHPHYHQPSDTFETIPLETYAATVQLSVNTARALDENLVTLAKPLVRD